MIKVDKEYYNSDHYKNVKEWLKSNHIELDIYRTRKSALLASVTPFGFLSCYRDEEGNEYYFCNGRFTNMTFFETE